MKKIILCIYAVVLLFPVGGQAQDDPVVGVLENLYWGTGTTDPIQLSARISEANKNTLMEMLPIELYNSDVEFIFRVYEYDQAAEKYYQSVHNDDMDLYGVIERMGDELAIAVDSDPAVDVASPRNYAFNISVLPQEMQQTVHIAIGAGNTIVKPWGLTVTAKASALGRAARSMGTEISRDCNIEQGFNYQGDEQSTCGFLVKMIIGDTDLATDFIIEFPDESGSVPVELASFAATRVSEGVALAWNTASEQGNLGFNVERSSSEDGPFEWVNTGLIPGALQSAEPVNYTFTDKDTPGGNLYYRLQQVDVTGFVTYSPVITCSDGVSGILVRGNKAGVTGSIPEFVQSLDGRTVRTEGAAPGMYLVRDGDSVTRIFKLR